MQCLENRRYAERAIQARGGGASGHPWVQIDSRNLREGQGGLRQGGGTTGSSHDQGKGATAREARRRHHHLPPGSRRPGKVKSQPRVDESRPRNATKPLGCHAASEVPLLAVRVVAVRARETLRSVRPGALDFPRSTPRAWITLPAYLRVFKALQIIQRIGQGGSSSRAELCAMSEISN